METLDEVSEWIAENLPDLIEKYDVPAAAVGVLADGRIVDHAAGVLSMSTGVEATTDSVFQIGSITKLWTSTLVMQLVDEGKVDLDATIRTYLPEFKIADEDAAAAITVRNLLTHTSGFEGDIFTDTGVGDDCIEKYLGVLHGVPQLFPPGERWSYCNAGFSVLGRLVEVFRGKPYDTVLREHLIKPLAIAHAATSPYEAIMFRAAVGHIEDTPGAGFHPAPFWAMERSGSPQGSMFAMNARGLLTFAQMHLEDGRAHDGSQVLAAGTTARMHGRQVGLPDHLEHYGTSWGLGFDRNEASSGLLIGHGGATIGQHAMLRIAPEAGVAVALLSNGGNYSPLFRAVIDHVLERLAGIQPRPETVPEQDPAAIDASRYAGVYRTDWATSIISQDPDGSVWIDEIPTGDLAIKAGLEPECWELVHLAQDTLITRERIQGGHMVLTFVDDHSTDGAQYLYNGGRAVPRAPD